MRPFAGRRRRRPPRSHRPLDRRPAVGPARSRPRHAGREAVRRQGPHRHRPRRRLRRRPAAPPRLALPCSRRAPAGRAAPERPVQRQRRLRRRPPHRRPRSHQGRRTGRHRAVPFFAPRRGDSFARQRPQPPPGGARPGKGRAGGPRPDAQTARRHRPDRAARRVRQPARAERLRQEHAHGLPQRPAPRHRRQGAGQRRGFLPPLRQLPPVARLRSAEGHRPQRPHRQAGSTTPPVCACRPTPAATSCAIASNRS